MSRVGALRRRVGALRRRLGLGTPQRVAWALYDWANSAFATTVVAAVFPIYYESVIGGGLPGNLATVYYSYTTAASLAAVALLAPVLGAIADGRRAKKPMLATFAGVGVVATAGLFFTGPGDVALASVLFAVANVGFVGANVFYDSLLSHVAGGDGHAEDPTDGTGGETGDLTDEDRPAEAGDVADRLSTAGYALGYLGGGLLLVVNLAWVLAPDAFGFVDEGTATRFALLSVAVWWAVFSLPLLLRVSEPAVGGDGSEDGPVGNPVRVGFARLRRTAGEIRDYPDLLLFLVAFLLYADGIGTIIRMASIYGSEIGIGRTSIVAALVLVQFLGIPFAVAFGELADRIRAKRALSLGLVVYLGISVAGFFMRSEWQFWVLAIAVATVQGGTQALSRSIYSRLVPPDRSAELFSFFSISSKVAGVAGPALFGVVAGLTGSSRYSILSLIVFFGGGLAVLRRVDLEAGERRARAAAADADARAGDGAVTDGGSGR